MQLLARTLAVAGSGSGHGCVEAINILVSVDQVNAPLSCLRAAIASVPYWSVQLPTALTLSCRARVPGLETRS